MELDFAIPCPLVRPRMPYPISVRQVAALLLTSFRRHLAMTPLCFASPSPPSGWTGDSHSPAIEHAGHTTPPPERRWLHVTAESRIGPPFGGLSQYESRRLTRTEPGFDVFRPHFIRHVTTTCNPSLVPSAVGLLAPITLAHVAIPCRLKPWGLLIPYKRL